MSINKSNKVWVLPKFFFYEKLKEMGITDENVEQYSHLAFISIQNTKRLDPSGESYFKRDHENAITLVFDDLTDNDQSVLEEFPGSSLFSEEDARRIVDFVDLNKERNFVVHCTAGISRSGAVGEYIRRELSIPYEDYLRLNPNTLPNTYVLSILCKIKSVILEKNKDELDGLDGLDGRGF